ncbi:MAG: acyl-CoA dehydrogenase family protein, partial [Actinomycetota bacterium]|nr:acyl-CoA dehydrogenase family protein [Actinomycetota bacterium]
MDATFSDDQRLFAETLRDILDGTCPPEAVRASWDDPVGWVDGLWDTLAATGVLGLTAPGSYDGLGMDEVDLVLLLEELGRVACPEPVAEHAAVAVPLLRDHGSDKLVGEWLGRAATGDAVVTV